MIEIKKRLDAFADAIIAIIVTIMVLELPINIHGGNLDYLTMFKAIGVYAVSFCFVANIWYQHAQAFAEVEMVARKTIIWDLILMFVLSLVPAQTRIMTSVETNTSVMMYGGLYLIVTFILRIIVKQIVHSKYTERDNMAKIYQVIYGDHNLELGGLIVANIVLAYFYPKIAMILFIVITVRAFFTGSGEQAEMDDANAMTDTGRATFMDLNLAQKRGFMTALRRYITRERARGNYDNYAGQDWDQFAQRMDRQYHIAPADLHKWVDQANQPYHGRYAGRQVHR